MVVTGDDDVFINFPFGTFMKLLKEFEDTVRRSPPFRWTMVVPVGAPKRENRRFMIDAVRRIQALGGVHRFTFEVGEKVFVPRQTVYSLQRSYQKISSRDRIERSIARFQKSGIECTSTSEIDSIAQEKRNEKKLQSNHERQKPKP
jgi:hypothetical protein